MNTQEVRATCKGLVESDIYELCLAQTQRDEPTNDYDIACEQL